MLLPLILRIEPYNLREIPIVPTTTGSLILMNGEILFFVSLEYA